MCTFLLQNGALWIMEHWCAVGSVRQVYYIRTKLWDPYCEAFAKAINHAKEWFDDPWFEQNICQYLTNISLSFSQRNNCCREELKWVQFGLCCQLIGSFVEKNSSKIDIHHIGLGTNAIHDDVIKWKHFPRYWPFVRGIHRSRWIPSTKASDAELWCFLWSAPDKRLSKQPWGWWFETPSWSLWRQCNVNLHSKYSTITVGYFLLLFPCLSRQFRLKDYSIGKTAMPDHIANSRVVSNYKCFPEPICYLGKTSKADQATCHRRQRTLNISRQNFG